jgi:hypothetical protein
MTLTNDFTWSFWANHSEDNTADNDIIFGNRMDETPADFVPRQFIKFTPTKFEWHMNGNGDDNLDYDDIPADIWLHHTVVKTADQLTYYRNGVEASSGSFTQPLDFPQPLYFGGDNEGADGENWSGLMSDVAIYDRALSEAEVRYLAGQRAVPVDPGDNGLLAFWACDEGEGAVVGDVSGNGHDGIRKWRSCLGGGYSRQRRGTRRAHFDRNPTSGYGAYGSHDGRMDQAERCTA